jgi:fluoride exporter
MTVLLFVLAAATGAGLRHGVNRLCDHAALPGWTGTLAVNVAGSFVLGFLVGSESSAPVLTVVGTGGCGAFTTFSTFALDAVNGRGRHTAIVVATSLGAGLAAAVAGYASAG